MDLARASTIYASAQRDGVLTPDECGRAAAAYLEVYERDRSQRTAYLSAAAVWEECEQLELAAAIY
ncbi:MAG: hypothetical protein KC636_25575, partial [Myxococcales bacterium]|nr:hypothetical protein [Myxococcales bacterium]